MNLDMPDCPDRPGRRPDVKGPGMTNPLADYSGVRSARDRQLDAQRRRAATRALAGMCRDADDFRELAGMLGLDAAEAQVRT